MADDYDDISNEYDRLSELSSMTRWKSQCKKFVVGFSTVTEFLSLSKINPFDIKLKGWSRQLNNEITDDIEYDEIFEKLHETYKNYVDVSPEIRLIFYIGSSAFSFHMAQKWAKSSEEKEPDLKEVFSRNPHLREQYEQELTRIHKERQFSKNKDSGGFLSTISELFTGTTGKPITSRPQNPQEPQGEYVSNYKTPTGVPRTKNQHQTPINQTPINQTPINQTPMNQTPTNQTQMNQTQMNQTQMNKTQIKNPKNSRDPEEMSTISDSKADADIIDMLRGLDERSGNNRRKLSVSASDLESRMSESIRT